MNYLKKFKKEKERDAQLSSDMEKRKDALENQEKAGIPYDEKMEGGEIKDECSCSEIFSLLRWSATCTHYYHFVTDSYAEHKALNKYYENIVDLLDSFIEAYSGVNGKMTSMPKTYECLPYSETAASEHLKKVRTDLEKQYEKLTHPNLKSEMDNILTQIDTTVYLLSLK